MVIGVTVFFKRTGLNSTNGLMVNTTVTHSQYRKQRFNENEGLLATKSNTSTNCVVQNFGSVLKIKFYKLEK